MSQKELPEVTKNVTKSTLKEISEWCVKADEAFAHLTSVINFRDQILVEHGDGIRKLMRFTVLNRNFVSRLVHRKELRTLLREMKEVDND